MFGFFKIVSGVFCGLFNGRRRRFLGFVELLVWRIRRFFDVKIEL